jgi:hypothetical protein
MATQFRKVYNQLFYNSKCIISNFVFFFFLGRMTNMCLDDSLKSKEAYGDDAEEFKPFRFVNANSSATKVDHSYVIFGGGRHACPGYLFYE